MKKKIIILDLAFNYNKLDHIELDLKKYDILALTPISFWYLDQKNVKYFTFHDILSKNEFKDFIIKLYNQTFYDSTNKFFEGVFIKIAPLICYLSKKKIINDWLKDKKYYDIIYITDRKISNKYEQLSNEISFFYFEKNIFLKYSKLIFAWRKSFLFYLKLKSLLYIEKNIYKFIKKLFFKKYLKYDWLEIFPKYNLYKITNKKEKIIFNMPLIFPYKKLSIRLNFTLRKISNLQTFLLPNEYMVIKNLKQDKSFYFFQHGSYLYKNLFIKFNEIKPADINFVFNDYTKKVFENLGAKKVYSVGSILFNRPIKERKKKYDFLYITQGHDYLGNLQYVDFPNSLHSFDGYELYQRHKKIIELFGTKFRDKKILIRVHPCIFTTGVYVPFWELAEPYPNVKIDVSIPIHNLIEKSKYIISDYFTTEFINRELHYKRDIIMFKGAPTPLPEETIKDMEKMFILVDSIDDLEEKVQNIEEITKNRKRYDDIIEYYSSKKCDTKKVVKEIIERELNARG